MPCYQVVEDTKLYKYRSEKNKQDYIGTAGVCGEMEGQVHYTAGRNIEGGLVIKLLKLLVTIIDFMI